ncbi:MAG: hypothetical protein JNK90_17225 [Planctomycetaceae bacterium]|nr:hypothetical protein [Planctomycetaceae bacterium]
MSTTNGVPAVKQATTMLVQSTCVIEAISSQVKSVRLLMKRWIAEFASAIRNNQNVIQGGSELRIIERAALIAVFDTYDFP